MKFLYQYKNILAIGIIFIISATLFFSLLTHNHRWDNLKNAAKNVYTSKHLYFKELVSERELRRGGLMFSFLKDISFIRYFPSQLTAFIKNLTTRNFRLSLMYIFLLLLIFSIFGIPIYYGKISFIFLPLLGFINIVFIMVFALFFQIKYSFLTYLLIIFVISCLTIAIRMLINKNSYKALLRRHDRKKDIYLPLILFLMGLFFIIGHLGHLDIPRSYDHMSYSTLVSLFKIEGSFPNFNVYAFPSMVRSSIPSGWIVIAAFISDLTRTSVPRSQLILVMLFFPFLGIGVYSISKMVFKGKGWAFCAGILALAMRMSSMSPTDGDMPEVLEWALIAFGLFALFSYLNNKDKRYFIFSGLSFLVSFMIHVKLALYTLAGLLFSLFFILFKRSSKEFKQVAFVYIGSVSLVFIFVLPYILFVKSAGMFGFTDLSLLEFFENMIFRHGYLMIAVIAIGIPFFIRSKNAIIIFCFAYFVMFFLYFDQWVLWELLRPQWYTKTFFSNPNFFGAVGAYTSFFLFLSTYSQIFSAFNIVLPILFTYAGYKLIPRKYFKVAGVLFVAFIIYESGIRPEVPAQLIGKADLNAAQWIRNNTDMKTTFVANIGSNPAYLWNISGVTERKCLNYRSLYFTYLNGKDSLRDINFEDLLKEKPVEAIKLLKRYRFSHVLVSEETILDNNDFCKIEGLSSVYRSDINEKVSYVFKLF